MSYYKDSRIYVAYLTNVVGASKSEFLGEDRGKVYQISVCVIIDGTKEEIIGLYDTMAERNSAYEEIVNASIEELKKMEAELEERKKREKEWNNFATSFPIEEDDVEQGD